MCGRSIHGDAFSKALFYSLAPRRLDRLYFFSIIVPVLNGSKVGL